MEEVKEYVKDAILNAYENGCDFSDYDINHRVEIISSELIDYTDISKILFDNEEWDDKKFKELMNIVEKCLR